MTFARTARTRNSISCSALQFRRTLISSSKYGSGISSRTCSIKNSRTSWGAPENQPYPAPYGVDPAMSCVVCTFQDRLPATDDWLR